MKENLNAKQKLKIPYKFDSRYVFEDSSTRIFKLITEIKQLEELITNTKLPYVFSDDSLPISFNYNLDEISSFDTFKEISWTITCKKIQSPIKLKFILTENTLDKTVLVVFEISIVKRELIPDKYKSNIIKSFEGIAVDIINNMIIKLKNDNRDIYHYESKIFDYSRDKLYNFISHLDEILKERGVFSSIIRTNEKDKEGTVTSFILSNDQTEIKIKVNKIDLNENKIKWTFNYMPLGYFYKDYLVEWTLVKVKENQTLVIINNLYYEQIEPSILKNLSKKKKDFFSIMEEELRKRYPH